MMHSSGAGMRALVMTLMAFALLVAIVTTASKSYLRDPNVMRGHIGPVYGFAVSHFDRSVVTGGEDKAIRFWDVETRTQSNALWGHSDSIVGIALSSDDFTVASSSMDGVVILWEAYSRRDLHL